MNLIPRGLKDAAFAYLPGIVTEHYKKMWLHAFPSSRIYMNIPIYGQNFDIKIGKHTSSASIIKVYGGLNDYKLMVEKKKMILHVGSYTAIGADLMLINRQGHTPEFVSISMASELFFRKCGGEIYTKNYRERYGDIIIANVKMNNLDLDISKYRDIELPFQERRSGGYRGGGRDFHGREGGRDRGGFGRRLEFRPGGNRHDQGGGRREEDRRGGNWAYRSQHRPEKRRGFNDRRY